MDFSFKDFSFGALSFEYYGVLIIALMGILFLLFEYFPGRNYFYSLHSLKKFIDKHLIKHLILGTETKKKSWIRSAVVSLVWLMLVVALANPRWDYEQIEGFKPNINILFLLDISKSMDARDEKPSRLERAKQEIVDIIKKSETANFGIIAFANQAHIVSPVTDDKNAIQYLLPSVTTDLVGVQGSNIEAGLRSAELLLKPLEGGVNYIIIMSDGGFDNSSQLQSLGKSLKGVKIITFGFGGTEGAPIPDAEGKFIKDGDKTVTTKLEKQNLILLSGLDNYIQSSYLEEDTNNIIRIIGKQLEVLKGKTKMLKLWHDRFYIPLLVAILLILPFFSRGAIFPIVLLFISGNAIAQEKPKGDIERPQIIDKNKLESIESIMFKNSNQQAKDLYEERQYGEAESKFSSAYNKGVAAYRNTDYAKAEQYFALEASKNLNAEYNMGTAQLMQMKLKECIATFESVLKKKPDHKDAKNNLDICKKLQKNPNNQNKQDDKQNESKQQQDQKDKQQNKDEQKNRQKDQQDNKEQDQQDKGDQQEQESDGKEQKKELDIQAKSILSKISSDPSKMMKSRFRYEEGNEQKSGGANVNPKPW